ncbi:MAG: histidinol dehydrogenase [Chthoniobacter sp.]|uniref:histidinol dehydrogenase n=1 Tax=Chthoniobacter sp. TaxID=2510640 RepID=UPI0032A40132
MRTLRYNSPGFSSSLRSLKRSAEPHPQVRKVVQDVIDAIRAEGDSALLEFTERFGGPRLTAKQLRLTGKPKVDGDTKQAIATAHANVLAFARKSLRENWTMKNAQGGLVGERFDAFRRVGIYVPGGTAPLVSTAVMTVTLAAAAGVPEIVVTTPSDADGQVNEALHYALQYCGATEIYRVGGAQAIGVLAHGTETIKPVQKIFGPGNAYVAEAKRQVFGHVAIDLLPGPSEILVLADATATAAWIAADLLAQAEHGKGSAIIFVTNSAKLLKDVESKIVKQLATLSRQDHLAGVLENGCTLILVKSLQDAVEIANDFAPEHIAIIAKDEDKIAARIHTAGAIFLGGFSPVAVGDFLAGPSHTLPTGGAGKAFPGLTVDMFQRRTSLVNFDAKALKKSLPTIAKFSEIEGLDAHGRSAAIRFE